MSWSSSPSMRFTTWFNKLVSLLLLISLSIPNVESGPPLTGRNALRVQIKSKALSNLHALFGGKPDVKSISDISHSSDYPSISDETFDSNNHEEKSFSISGTTNAFAPLYKLPNTFTQKLQEFKQFQIWPAQASQSSWSKWLQSIESTDQTALLWKSGRYLAGGYLVVKGAQRLLHMWQRRQQQMHATNDREFQRKQKLSESPPSYFPHSTIFTETDSLQTLQLMASLIKSEKLLVSECKPDSSKQQVLQTITTILVDDMDRLCTGSKSTHSGNTSTGSYYDGIDIRSQTYLIYQSIQSLVELFDGPSSSSVEERNATTETNATTNVNASTISVSSSSSSTTATTPSSVPLSSSSLFTEWLSNVELSLLSSQVYQIERALQGMLNAVLEVSAMAEKLLQEQNHLSRLFVEQNYSEEMSIRSVLLELPFVIECGSQKNESNGVNSSWSQQLQQCKESSDRSRQYLKILQQIMNKNTQSSLNPKVEILPQRIVLKSLLKELYLQTGVIQMMLQKRPSLESNQSGRDELTRWVDEALALWKSIETNSPQISQDSDKSLLNTAPVEEPLYEPQSMQPNTTSEDTTIDEQKLLASAITSTAAPSSAKSSSGSLSWIRRMFSIGIDSSSPNDVVKKEEEVENEKPIEAENAPIQDSNMEKRQLLMDSISNILSRQYQIMKFVLDIEGGETNQEGKQPTVEEGKLFTKSLKNTLLDVEDQLKLYGSALNKQNLQLVKKDYATLQQPTQDLNHHIHSPFSPFSRPFQVSLLCLAIIRRQYGLALNSRYALHMMGYRMMKSLATLKSKYTALSTTFEETGKAVRENVINFGQRRLFTPLSRIINDVVFNKHPTLADIKAVQDAKQSLTNMIRDFLQEFHPEIDPSHKKQILDSMDMSPISQEYEVEIKKPLQNIMSGRIARLLLIQLQFMKKEMLSAKMAIDDLMNANQIHLQVLAITPAVIVLYWMYSLYQSRHHFIRESLRFAREQKESQSIRSIYHHMFLMVKDIEEFLCLQRRDSQTSDNLTLMEHGQLLVKIYSLLDYIHHRERILKHNNGEHSWEIIEMLKNDLLRLSDTELSVQQYRDLIKSIQQSYRFLRLQSIKTSTVRGYQLNYQSFMKNGRLNLF